MLPLRLAPGIRAIACQTPIHLPNPDPKTGGDAEAVEALRPPADPFGDRHHEAHPDEGRGDHVEGAQVVLDPVLEEHAADDDRDRSNDDRPTKPGFLSARGLTPAKPTTPAYEDPNQIAAEVNEDGEKRPELDRGRERGTRIGPSEKGRHDAQVRGA